MNFIKRTTDPNVSNKYYIHTSCNGVNSCILINNCSVLPNCVGYAWGRSYELMNSMPSLSRGNAEGWYNYDDGYKRGNLPKLGAIACWKSGNISSISDGLGHVAVVEEIYSDGGILVSNSAYGGLRFYTKKIPNNYYFGTGFEFQGFIYLPVDFTIENIKANEEIAKEVLQGLWGNNPERKIKLEAAGYDYEVIQNLVNIMLTKTEVTDVIYTVKSGDTLSSIAKKYNVQWLSIYNENKSIIGSNPNLIKPGQKLIIKL
ncbi:MAG: LysM peptidoglycan-binding domain-containing protein [bacterium]